MSKGIAPVVVAILLILVTLSLAIMFYSWSSNVVQIFETTSEGATEQRISEAKSSFFIKNVSGRELGIKNNGEIPLDTNDFSIYLNDTLVETDPGTDNLGPGNATTFNITSSFTSGNYSIKVSGPYGKYDRTFDELVSQVVITTTSTTSTSTSSSTSTSTTSTSTSTSTSTTSTSTTSSTTSTISPTYFDDWTSDNTGDWKYSNTGNNHRHWWLDNGQDFTSPKEFEMEANLLDWDCGDWDHTNIGWTADKSNYYGDVEHVSIYWEHKDSTYGGPCTDDSEVLVKLHLRNSGSTYTTSLKSFPQPSSSDNIRVILSYTSNTVSYEIKNLDTGSVLASDSITDSSKIPSPSSTKYLFFQAWDYGGGIFNYNSPTYINWGNHDTNGGMEWRTDYWSVEGI